MSNNMTAFIFDIFTAELLIELSVSCGFFRNSIEITSIFLLVFVVGPNTTEFRCFCYFLLFYGIS